MYLLYRRESGQGVVMSSIMLVSAVLASMVFGVLVAYGVCMAMFKAFRMHAKQVAAERSVTATAQISET